MIFNMRGVFLWSVGTSTGQSSDLFKKYEICTRLMIYNDLRNLHALPLCTSSYAETLKAIRSCSSVYFLFTTPVTKQISSPSCSGSSWFSLASRRISASHVQREFSRNSLSSFRIGASNFCILPIRSSNSA